MVKWIEIDDFRKIVRGLEILVNMFFVYKGFNIEILLIFNCWYV